MSSNLKIVGFLLGSFLFVFAWSAIHPHDYFTWLLEIFPAVVGIAVLLATYRHFRFTTLVYVLVWFHAIILVIGGHYTYAEMPLFNWVRDTFSLSRNYYDRVGHFAQGFAPSIISREILLRKSLLKQGKWLFFIVVCICLALSAFYEFTECWVALATGTAATDFLGTQGDIWDTQWDMFLAMCGAIISQLILSKTHDKALERLSINRK